MAPARSRRPRRGERAATRPRRPAAYRGTDDAAGLESIPGIGPSLAEDLRRLGIERVRDLKGRSPEGLYARLCRLECTRVDRCVLYAFRCAVYYASRRRHDPELLKWWNWKDARDGRAAGHQE